jgi:hypothetical protein
MITLAILALILAPGLAVLWPTPKPALTCVLIAFVSLMMRFAP